MRIANWPNSQKHSLANAAQCTAQHSQLHGAEYGCLKGRRQIAYWKRAIRLSFGLVLPFVSVACTFEDKAVGVVGETNLQVNSRRDVFWLDNDRLVFAGADNGTGQITNFTENVVRFPEDKARIYIWKMGSAPAAYKAAWPERGTQTYQNYLCAADGNIFYSLKAGPNIGNPGGWRASLMAGPIGHEKPIQFEFKSGDEWSRRRPFDSVGIRCDQVHQPQMKGHEWKISYSRDRILDFGPRTKPTYWIFKKLGSSGSEPIRLLDTSLNQSKEINEIDSHWVNPSCTQSPSWEDAFVVRLCTVDVDLSKIDFLPVWKIDANGDVKRTDVPTGHLSVPDIVSFRRGYILVNYSTSRQGSENEVRPGIYHVSHGQLELIASGYYRTLAVSPNGCLAAFAKATVFMFADAREHLIVFDLCKAIGG